MTATAAPQAGNLSGVKLWVAALGLALVNFTVILDNTITNVSIPHIAGSLAIAPNQGTWTITSYAIAEAITVPLSGWLAARFGTMRTLLWSLIGFAVFSMLCGFARTIELLVLFRVFQGLCGGPLMPMTQTLLLRIFPPEKIATANAMWAVTTIFAPVLGPLVGGWISENWSWPWIFFINLPVTVIAYLVITRMLGDYETATRRERIDAVGLGLLVVFVSCLQLVLDLGRDHDWFASNMIVTLAVVSVVTFGAFVIWELTDPHPAVDLRVLRHRNLAVSTVAMATGYGSVFAMIVLVPLWLQTTLGYTAEEAGKSMSLMGLSALFWAVVAGKFIAKYDARLAITGGMLWLVVVALSRADWSTDSTFWQIGVSQLMQGVGMPFFFIGVMTMGLTAIPPQEIPSAAGLISFMRTVSGAIATALATAMWDSSAREAHAQMAGSLNGADVALGGLQTQGIDETQGRAMIESLVEAQASTMGAMQVYTVAAIVLFLAAWVVWLAPRVRPSANGAPMGH